MEAQYGHLFLSNWQRSPLTAPLATSTHEEQEPAVAVGEPALAPGAACGPTLAPAPTIASPPTSGVPVTESGVRQQGGKPSAPTPLFALKPPPPPTAKCAVGSPAGADAQAVVIDELRAANDIVQPKIVEVGEEEERFNVTGAIAYDDEQNLLESNATRDTTVHSRHVGDGIDSESESDGAGSPLEAPEARPATTATEASAPLPAGAPTPHSPPTNQVSPAGMARPSAARVPLKPCEPDGDTPGVGAHAEPRSLMTEAQAVASSERFVDDEGSRNHVASEVQINGTAIHPDEQVHAGTSAIFRVQVPKPYPGVQYRRSKNLEDKYSRYAADGVTVSGVVEECGDWLKISGTGGEAALYLPMRIGSTQILKPVGDAPTKKKQKNSKKKKAQHSVPEGKVWWTCCPTKEALESSEVVVDHSSDATGGASPSLMSGVKADGGNSVGSG